MHLGIFARTFARPTLAQVLDAVTAHGLRCVQFNLACVGLASLPDAIPPDLPATIRQEMAARGLEMAAVSGTFNMIHPDAKEREAGLRRLGVLARACRPMGVRLVTLCTGTRDPQDMWRDHPANRQPEAWADLCAALGRALALAEECDLILGIEPELANVVHCARAARQLLDQLRSPRLKIVVDPANLFPAGALPRMRRILTEAFDLLGGDVVLAHAKDLSRDGQAGHEAAGTGVLDYDLYLELLHAHRFSGPLVLHGLSEPQVPTSAAWLRAKLARLGADAGGA